MFITFFGEIKEEPLSLEVALPLQTEKRTIFLNNQGWSQNTFTHKKNRVNLPHKCLNKLQIWSRNGQNAPKNCEILF